MLSRNFCQKHMRLNFRNFHTVQCGHILRFWNLWWTKINRKRSWCSRLKKAEREFLQIPHWSVIWLFSSHKKKKIREIGVRSEFMHQVHGIFAKTWWQWICNFQNICSCCPLLPQFVCVEIIENLHMYILSHFFRESNEFTSYSNY